MKGPGVYIHLPFCRSKCGYCDFHSVARLDMSEAYVGALLAEADSRVGAVAPSTVYLGGGTPSSLAPELLSRIFERFDGQGVAEYTIEVNPDDVTPEFARFLSGGPARRVSMGVQSLCDAELAVCGRRHDSEGAVRAYHTLRYAGIENISLDLIYGLPGQTLDSWRHSLDGVIALGPDHLSAYMLSYEPGTRFSAMRSAGKIGELPEDLLVEMYGALTSRAREAGFEHYEISNFARPGRRAVHNSAYWDGSDYIGLGTGAHSCVKGVRSYNPADIRRYIAQGGVGFSVVEQESADNRFNDMLITRLRTSDGLRLAEVPADRLGPLMEAAGPHIAAGRMAMADGVLKMNEDAWLVSDDILVDLIV